MQIIPSTWDHHTDRRIKDLHPELCARTADFINHVERNNGLRLRVTSTYRSFEEQDALYAVGRTKYQDDSPVTNAKAGESYHNYGLAFDVVPIDPQGQPVWNSLHWDEIGIAGEYFGFEWGGRWTRPDRPHFQRTFEYTTDELEVMRNNGSKHPLDSRFVDFTQEDLPPARPDLQKLTSEDLEALIEAVEYTSVPASTATVCVLRLHCGFIVTGQSACLNPEDFDLEIGKDIAYEKAFEKLWDLEGYHQLRSRDAPS